MNRTYIQELDRANRQDNTAVRARKYFQPVTVVESVSEHGTVRIKAHTLKVAHGYNEPEGLGNLNRTKRRIWTGEAIEQVHGLMAYPIQRFTRKQRRNTK